MQNISIHALREEGDLMMLCSSVSAILFLSTPSARRATHPAPAEKLPAFISIHALREEGDFWRAARTAWVVQFLSTPSARRATKKVR